MIYDDFTTLSVPCGKCIECRKQRVNSWFIRLENELYNSKSAYFVTLTYDETTLPFTDSGYPTLDYTDVQRYIKRIRKTEAKKHDNKVMYYCAGEYGSTYHRPHYHLIIFNVSSEDILVNEWREPKKNIPLGFVHIGKVEAKSIYYTLKYTLKGSVNEKDELTDRLPEKALMSKGLGEKFLTDKMKNYYLRNPNAPVTLLGNKKLGLPRYYRDKIFIGEHEDLKLVRNQMLKKHVDKIHEKRYEKLYTQKIKKRYERIKENLKKTE